MSKFQYVYGVLSVFKRWFNKMRDMKFIDSLERRYATKIFDSSKVVGSEDIEIIKSAIQLSPSSFGLQLYKVIIVTDSKIKAKLRAVSADQSQITDSSHLFIFCNYTSVTSKDVDEFIDLVSYVRDVEKSDLSRYSNFIKGAISSMDIDSQSVWTEKQVYIALENLLFTAANLDIDTCPMEGFDSASYNEILGLENKGLNASVAAAVGYRSVDDSSQHLKKVRKSKSVLFEEI